MQTLAVQTSQRNNSLDILQRIAQRHKSALKDSIDSYGDLIWSMAKKFTDTTEDAEAVTQEIFLNIWRYAARFEETNFDELLFITIIARRQLRKYKVNQSTKNLCPAQIKEQARAATTNSRFG
jgi:RNA polymerase sigma-70 factor (ECF subfamily)